MNTKRFLELGLALATTISLCTAAAQGQQARPALAPRDRSLVTVSALIASGQVAQIPYHLNKAMDNGMTRAQASEVLTHLAFYAGWPNVFSALPVVKNVFEKRPG